MLKIQYHSLSCNLTLIYIFSLFHSEIYYHLNYSIYSYNNLTILQLINDIYHLSLIDNLLSPLYTKFLNLYKDNLHLRENLTRSLTNNLYSLSLSLST